MNRRKQKSGGPCQTGQTGPPRLPGWAGNRALGIGTRAKGKSFRGLGRSRGGRNFKKPLVVPGDTASNGRFADRLHFLQ